MPSYTVDIVFVDAYGREGRKRFESIASIVDEAAAVASAAGLLSDLAAFMEADILRYTISREILFSDSVVAGANVDEGGIFTFRKEDTKRGAIRFPTPINAAFNADQSLDLTNAVVLDLANNFIAGSGDWTFSDGEQATSLLSGYLEKP